MTAMMNVHGRKGGSKKPKAPTEAPDSLQSVATAKILLAVGEGEFDGTPTARDIYLDNTPLADASGNLNFPGVKWEWRPGSIDQEYIPGIPSVENDTQLNIELRSDTPFVRSVTNTQLSAVRLRFAWPALQRQDNEGNIGGYRIEYAVDVATDGGAYVEVLRDAVDGKTTTRYERSRRIDLPAADTGWQIRVRRLTANANNNRIADTMLVAGLAEVIDAKIEYRNTALLFVEFSAEQFTNIPAVTVDCKARKWPVPSNYDPETRTYTGIWDGAFKEAWTNNPAWVTYGLCINDRFGLGRRIKPWMVDKWELYRIAQYCDQLVPDGKGGQEPRFLCDMNLQAKAEAWALLRDIAAIYRGMTYWAQGQLMSQADMPRAQDFDYVFTRANVVDGKFAYGSASARTRYSRALVSYDNPANNYDTDVTAVTDKRLQRRYRDNPVEISAIGCTRESEAQRRGKWLLMSNSQDRTVTFSTGMEGRIPLPGYVIPVADSLLAGREIGGRIRAAAGRVITLDRDTQASPGDRLVINLPSGVAEGRTIQQVNGRDVTVTTAYSEVPAAQLVWALDADDLAIQLYRVMKTVRNAQGDYEITALQYEPSKFAHIDTGAKLETRPISVIPVGSIDPPASVEISSYRTVDQGIAIHTMTIAWPSVSGAVAYDVEWRKDSGNWIRVPRTGALSIDVSGIYAGGYVARVRAVSAWDIASISRESMLTHLQGKEGAPPAIAYFNTAPLVFGIRLDWGFPEGAEDTQRTEIEYNTAQSEEGALHLGDYAYPGNTHTMTGLAAAARFFFRARLVDRTGNIGPWSDWVMGQSSADAGEILDYLADQITESQLGQHLKDEIGKISGDGPGSVNERIDEVSGEFGNLSGEIDNLNNAVAGLNDQVSELDSDLQGSVADLNQQISQLETQLADITGAEDWSPDQAYLSGSLVRLDGSLYRAEQDVPAGTPVSDTTYWRKVGDYASIGEAVAALAIQVTDMQVQVDEITGAQRAYAETLNTLVASTRGQRADGDKADALRGWETQASITQRDRVEASDKEALAERLLLMDAQIGDTSAQLSTLEQAFASESEATAGRLDQLAVELGTTTAGLQQEIQVRIDQYGALAQDIQAMQAELEGVATSAALAALRAEVEEVEGRVTSSAQDIVSLSTSLGTVEQTANAAQQAAQDASNLAGSKGKVFFQSSAPAAAERLPQNLWIDTTGGANTPKRWNGSAWVAVTDKVATDAAEAAQSALDGLSSKADSSALQAVSSTVTEQGNTITSQGQAITALGGRVEDAESGIAGNADAIESVGQEVQLLDGKVTATADQASRIAASIRPARADGDKADALRGYQSQASIAESRRVTATEAEASAERDLLLQSQLADTNAALLVEQETRATADSALAEQAVSMRAEIEGVSATVGQVESASVSRDEALGQRASTIEARMPEGDGQLATGAAVQQVQQAVADESSARAEDISTVQAEIGTVSEAAQTAQSAADQAAQDAASAAGIAEGKGKVLIQSAAPAVADRQTQNLWIDTTGGANTPKRWAGTSWQPVTDKAATDAAAAAATAQDTANQAAQEAGEAAAAVQTVSQAVADLEGDVSTMWSVRMQVNQNGEYVYAGIGLGIENGPGGLQSQFLVEANRFALLNTIDGETTVPFVVEDGQTIINSAVIKQADIINLIVTGVLQSPDYVPETSGIRLNFVTGEFELNGSVPGQGRLTLNNQLLKVFRPDGGLKLRLGIWG